MTQSAPAYRGLDYPLGQDGPAPGEIIWIADGIGWARFPVPGPLKHVHVWLLEEEDGGFLAVDSALDIPECRDAWEAIFAGPLKGKSLNRILCTHFHPDHVGLAGWLCARFDVPLLMTREEWLFARLLVADQRDAPPPEQIAIWRGSGWEEERITAEAAKGWGRFAAVVTPLPVGFRRICEGDVVQAAGRDWRIVTGNGHSPDHACLLDETGSLFISGDQVLPRISSNISLSLSEPEGDPLGDWLGSLDKLGALSDELLVLPSHGPPFRGLHARLDALKQGHRTVLAKLHDKIATNPARAVDCFVTLFGRTIDDRSYGLATGEALAHLRHLALAGRAVRETRDNIWWFTGA